MFEMTLYNPAYSMFSSVVIIFEFPLQGGIDTTINIQVLRLLQNMTFDQIDFLLFICWGVLLIVTIVKAVSVVKAIVRQKVTYLKDFWNWLEFGIVVCSIITFIMAITCEVISSQDLLQYSAEKHIQIRHITELYKIYSTALSLVVFMSILRYIQLLRFNKRLLLLSTTLKFAWLNMKGFFWVYLIVTLAFAHMGNIAMGKIIEAFSTMESSLSYLLTISVGSSRYFDAITVLMPRFGEMFLMVYTFFMITVILNIFIAIITEAYESAKDYLEQQQNQFEMVEYMKQRFKDTAYMQFGVDLAVLSTKEENCDEEPQPGQQGEEDIYDKLTKSVARLTLRVHKHYQELDKETIEDIKQEKIKKLKRKLKKKHRRKYKYISSSCPNLHYTPDSSQPTRDFAEWV
ncbi:polycystin-2-like protein 2 [Glandiceps talaboti]